jgi:hypothetical protein
MAHGKLAKVVSFERRGAEEDVVVDTGGGALVTAAHLGGAGEDSPPLPGDVASLDDSSGTGNQQVTGYHDPLNTGKADDGEKRIYGRNAAGEVVAEVWLKGDGTVLVQGKIGDNELSLTLDLNTGIATLKTPTFKVEADSILLGKGAGREVACVGDLVAVTVPQLLSAAPGSPCVPAIAGTPNPAYVTASLGTVAAGQIISGRPNVKAG